MKKHSKICRCEVDQHFLETPNYSRFKDYPEDSYVFQEMSVFKFPGDGDLLFHCKISLCNMNDPNAPCNQSIVGFLEWIIYVDVFRFQPPKCPKKVPVLPVRQKRSVSAEEMASPEWRSKQIRKRQTELKNRSRRQIVETKAGYYMTLQVETRLAQIILQFLTIFKSFRTLNVLLSESIRPRDSVKYCDIS